MKNMVNMFFKESSLFLHEDYLSGETMNGYSLKENTNRKLLSYFFPNILIKLVTFFVSC